MEAQINLFKLVIAFYRTFDPKRVVRDFLDYGCHVGLVGLI